MKRTPLSTNGAIWGTHWMPARLKDTRGPLRLQEMRTREVAAMVPCAADRRGAGGTAAGRSDATSCRVPRRTPPPGDRRRPRKSLWPPRPSPRSQLPASLAAGGEKAEHQWSNGLSSQGHRGGTTVWAGWGTSQAYAPDVPFAYATTSDKRSAMSLHLYVARIAPAAMEFPSSSAPGLS
jgi:hypothetical protein